MPFFISITILDAAELDLGSLRLRQGGSSGGQNGMGNIIEILKTKDIPRIKVGIGAPPRVRDISDTPQLARPLSNILSDVRTLL
jgi:PTH1 family peptidyl-tRNA hydrolase